MDGLRMSREDTDSDGEIGVFHYGKRFRYSKREIVAGKMRVAQRIQGK
jgi:hypothetical protein